MSLFITKKKDRTRSQPVKAPNGPPRHQVANPLKAGQSSAPSSSRIVNGSSSSSSSAPQSDPSKIVEFKLVSSGKDDDTRYNMMRLDSKRDADPRALNRPILLNRKPPGPRAPPIFATNEEGKVIGRYVYDNEGKPVMDSSGEHVIEKRSERDMSLVGSAPGQGDRRKVRKGVKEVYHQDLEVIRLRREEHMPWILESGNPHDPHSERRDQGGMPEHWVGRMTEPSSMPTVLLVNDGTMGMGFKVVSLGRSYRFVPERPFKVLDPDAAHKLYEHHTKYKLYDRWAQREGGPVTIAGPSNVNGSAHLAAEQRAQMMDARARLARGEEMTRVKRESFDDDYKREGRMLERGMEGGVDEELDYDFKEEFQDDEENNTFYQDREEEEEAKLQEEQLKKEFRMANANVGDRPQIEDELSDEEDLFGDKLNQEGKRLRKMMKKRGVVDDDFEESESDDDSDSETIASGTKSKNGDDDKRKERDGSRSRDPSVAPSDGGRPSRPSSRQGHSRGTSSPTGAGGSSGRRPQPPAPGKASTAPPGAGSAFLAQRAASRGASPRHSRQASPRAQSPDGQRGSSPTSREVSPTPSATGSVGGTSNPNKRKGGPGGGPQPGQKRKTPVHSLSPGPGAGSSPGPSSGDGPTRPMDPSRKKKKSSSTTPTPGPPDVEPFPEMITRDEVVAWFRKGGKNVVPMAEAIGAFKVRIRSAGDRQSDNQRVFLSIVNSITTSEPDRMLRIKDGVL